MKITSSNFTRILLPVLTIAALIVPAKIAKDRTEKKSDDLITQKNEHVSEIDSNLFNYFDIKSFNYRYQDSLPFLFRTHLCEKPDVTYVAKQNKLQQIVQTKPIPTQSEFITKNDLEGLKIITEVNFAGGVIHCYDSASVQKLKQRIFTPESQLTFKAPIENAPNIYLEPFGYFFANRPNGNKKRPHMGLDIFISPYSRKPKNPVLIQAPVDGVIISHKRARKEDNVIGNAVTLLGCDGRKYSFDHMARPDDYPDSIPMPTVGTVLKAGDPIGYAGCTGETSLWHLHFSVMTDEAKQMQLNSKMWQTLASQAGYSKIKGQVNPLDKKAAGPVAELLSKYRGAKLNLVGDFVFEEENTTRK